MDCRKSSVGKKVGKHVFLKNCNSLYDLYIFFYSYEFISDCAENHPHSVLRKSLPPKGHDLSSLAPIPFSVATDLRHEGSYRA